MNNPVKIPVKIPVKVYFRNNIITLVRGKDVYRRNIDLIKLLEWNQITKLDFKGELDSYLKDLKFLGEIEGVSLYKEVMELSPELFI